MADSELDDFLIVRALDEPIDPNDLSDATDASGEALSALRDEGVDIQWVESDVMETPDGQVEGTVCHYRAEDTEAIERHADRAGLPATIIAFRGEPLDGE